MTLYTKNKAGEFIPVEIDSVLSSTLNDSLVVIRVGTDEFPATLSDIETAAESFAKATVLDDLDNISVVLTPYQITIDLADDAELNDKNICLQITSGDDVKMLDKITQKLYAGLKKKHDKVAVVPGPLTFKDYREVQDTIERCKIRKRRRHPSR